MTSGAAGEVAARGAAGQEASLARWRRALALATCAALSVFIVAMAAAVGAYPGGSWTLPSATGFSVARNFWCDLLRSQAINGADNAAGKLWASVAFGALGVALWPYWWVAGSLLCGRERSLVTRLGSASAACLAAMTVLPSDRFRIVHGVVALSGALLGMAAAGVSVSARARGEPRLSLRRSSGVLALLLSSCNALLYVYVAYLGGAETMAQPLAQKLATAALLAWMFVTLRHALAGENSARTEPLGSEAVQ